MIKSIKAILAQDKEKFKVPRKVQDLIPIKNIWPDGIFKVGNKFSKSFRFSDINYLVASREDKESMFLTYSELLNSLDSGATTKITINNHRLNRSDFEESILMPMKQDGLDEYRKEYNDMLLDKATGANGITQEKYITITVAKKDIEEARAYFARIGVDLTAHFANLGSKCVPLNAVERLRILHDFYRPGDEAAFSFDMNRKARLGHDFRDYICPDSVERTADHIKLGEKYARVLFLKDYASYIKDSMFSELTELNRNLMLSVDVIPIPTDEAVREVERLLLGVETNITGWQRRQNQNNNFSAVVPYDMELQRKESKEFLDDLTTRDQRMMFAVVTMVITADTKEQLDLDTETVLSTARKHMCQMATLKYQQTDGLNTVLPIGTRKINAFRTLTTESLAVLMPFKVQEIMDKGGIYFGENAISHNLIMCNKANLLNQSAFLLGVPGSGKSFSAKELLMVPVSKMSKGLYGTVNMLLKCVFYSAIESDVIKDNPAACINPRGGKAKKEKVALTDKQIGTLLDTIKGLPPYLFVMLGLYAGLRREEILGLQWDCVHIDEDIPYISVRRAWRSVKNRPEVTTLLKTLAAKRDIPIPQILADCLKAEKEKSSSDYVISDSNGEPLSDSQFCRLWHYITVRRVKERKIYRYINGEKIHHTISPKLGERCRTDKSIYYTLDFNVTPHLLRHTYITNLIHEGVDPKTVQYLAGHENSKVTMDIYAKVKYNKPWELAAVVNEAFQPSTEYRENPAS